MNRNDANFFRPMWRRVAVVVFLSLWLGYEVLISKEQMWILIVGGVLAYSVWSFFISFDRDANKSGDDGTPKP